MNAYEEILQMMRQEGGKDNIEPVKVGIMDSPTSCSIGKLKLARDDLLIAEHLVTGYQKTKEEHVSPLRKGDQVAIQRVNDELYIILERLV